MITGWDIYWITRLDDIRHVLLGVTLFSALALFIIFVLCAAGNMVNQKGQWVVISFIILIFSCGVITRTFIPTTKQMAMIKVVPAIVNNETIQAECKEFYNLAKDGLKELVGKKNKSK